MEYFLKEIFPMKIKSLFLLIIAAISMLACKKKEQKIALTQLLEIGARLKWMGVAGNWC